MKRPVNLLEVSTQLPAEVIVQMPSVDVHEVEILSAVAGTVESRAGEILDVNAIEPETEVIDVHEPAPIILRAIDDPSTIIEIHL